MDARSSQPGQIIEINVDLPQQTAGVRRIKVCGAPCELSDATAKSKEVKDRHASMRKLFIVVALCAIFMTVEIVGGIFANSLAILTDAAHLLSDVAAFAISLFSLWAAGWEATPRQSYGFYRIEILGALVSMQIIWLITGILIYEAIARLIHHTGEVNGFLMFVVASFGLLVNVSMATLLGHDHGGHSHGHAHGHSHGHSHGHAHGHAHDDEEEGHQHHHHEGEGHQHLEGEGHQHHEGEEHQHHEGEEHHHHHEGEEHHHHETKDAKEEGNSKPLLSKGKPKKRRNVNIQGAYLHVLGDSIQSVGVMIAGGIIWWRPEWKIVDLICTLLFSVIVLTTTFRMLRNVLEVLMESTPREVDATKLEEGLLKMEEVLAIHELHIWAITVGKILLACHVKIRPEADADVVLHNVINFIEKEYNISHVTIQIER